MSRPKMTASHRQQMRENILDSAYSILIEKGPEHISSRAVAEHLDLTHMGLFTYFPSQPAILQALSEREQLKTLDQLMLLTTRSGLKNFPIIVEEALIFFQKSAENNPNVFRLAWIMPEMAGEGTGQAHWMQPTIDLMARLIRAGSEQGSFMVSDPEFAATMVICIVNMPYILSYCGKITGSELREKMAQAAISEAMRYLRICKKPERDSRMSTWEAITAWVRKKFGWFDQ